MRRRESSPTAHYALKLITNIRRTITPRFVSIHVSPRPHSHPLASFYWFRGANIQALFVERHFVCFSVKHLACDQLSRSRWSRYLSPGANRPAELQRDIAPSVTRVQKSCRVGHLEIRQGHRLS